MPAPARCSKFGGVWDGAGVAARRASGSGPGSLRYCSRRPSFGFLAQRDGRRATALAAEVAALAGLLRPQRRLVFRVRSFKLGNLRAFVLFAPGSGLVLAPLRFAPETCFALGRCQLLTHGGDREALLKPAALNASACRPDARRSLFFPCRDRPWHRIVFGFTRHRGCCDRGSRESGLDRRISCR